MLASLLAAAVIAAFSVGGKAQCPQIDGNYYCAQTSAIKFNNIGFSGTYNQVTSMDSSTCECTSQPVSFGGGLAPLNHEV